MVVIGDLDGATRVTRIGEEYYHAKTQNKLAIIVGGNHAGFLDSAPEWIHSSDLKAEITTLQYQEQLGVLFANFLKFVTTNIDTDLILQYHFDEAIKIIEPAVAGYLAENSYFYSGPDQIGPNWDTDICPSVWQGDRGLCDEPGPPWSIYAQKYVSGFEPPETSELGQMGYEYKVDSEMVALSSRPSLKCPGNI